MADANLIFASPRRVKRSGMEINMTELAETVCKKLEKMSDEEFAEIIFTKVIDFESTT